jgi:hypothetical protein
MTMVTTVRVKPNWRVCVNARAYEAGETVEVPILQAIEWCAWGSTTHIGPWRDE